MSPQLRTDRESNFAGFLRGLATQNNRAALAALRRGLSAHAAASAAMHRYLAGWLHDTDSEWDVERFYLVAALFGRYPSPAKAECNFGGSYRLLHQKRESASVERRFVALLASDAESIGVHLRHAIALISTEDIAVDWARLLRDLKWWPHPERRVQRRWAREFWRYAPQEPAEPAAEGSTLTHAT